jgi:putative ABC transport system substrate-binding protein
MTDMIYIGLLHSGSEETFRRETKYLIEGLGMMNYWAGEDDLPQGYKQVKIKPLYANDSPGELEENARQFAGDNDIQVVVAAGGPQSARTAKEIIREKSIVFTTVVKPVRLGLVESLAHPGGNLTGMAGRTSELDAARLIMLHRLLPPKAGKRTIAVVIRKNRPLNDEQYEDLEDAADALRMDLDPYHLGEDDLPRKLQELAEQFRARKDRNEQTFDAVLVTADSLSNNRRKAIVDIFNLFKLPAIYQWREFADIGGLISYGPSIREAYTSAGVYVGCILDGKPPGEIPVSEPTRKELVINLRTAQDLSIAVPNDLRDEAILIS